MRLDAPSLKPAAGGVIVGIVAIMIVGFSWMGWVLGGTAEQMAEERANSAVIAGRAPSGAPGPHEPCAKELVKAKT